MMKKMKIAFVDAPGSRNVTRIVEKEFTQEEFVAFLLYEAAMGDDVPAAMDVQRRDGSWVNADDLLEAVIVLLLLETVDVPLFVM